MRLCQTIWWMSLIISRALAQFTLIFEPTTIQTIWRMVIMIMIPLYCCCCCCYFQIRIRDQGLHQVVNNGVFGPIAVAFCGLVKHNWRWLLDLLPASFSLFSSRFFLITMISSQPEWCSKRAARAAKFVRPTHSHKPLEPPTNQGYNTNHSFIIQSSYARLPCSLTLKIGFCSEIGNA